MTRYSLATVLALFLTFTVSGVQLAHAQPPDSTPAQPPAASAEPTAQAAPPSDDDDAKLRPAEPDYVTINLPTTLPLPPHAMVFHLSHRFNEDLLNDSIGTQFSNVFGLDTGANIGLEFRYGVMKHLEAIVMRTSLSKTIQFSAKYDGWHQTATMPVGVSVIVSIEGDNNFHNTDGGAQANYAPAIGAVLSRTVTDRLALYVSPMWVHNTGTGSAGTSDTGFIGLGGRARLGKSTYFVLEGAPRAGGLAIGQAEYAFAIEERVGAHVFALTFSNSVGTTYRQLAHGGVQDHL
ncbi:MAG TPA: DUF5777 family beta-barrel protein, partial [Vicinamibacterales bacterium]|nr:DUF5777 family beta-barrel protein [Vicinamibacterales bacterium]